MKKLMIALAAVAMAVSANAAVTKWQLANSRIPVATDPTKDQSGIVTGTTGDMFTGLVVQLLFNGDVVASGTTANGLIAGSQLWTQQQTIDAIAANGGDNTIPFSIAAVYTTDTGTYTYHGNVSQNLGNVASGSRDVNVIINMGTAGSWDYVANPVPEPTSGLLLLLGVAGLALRRRRA